MKQNLLIVIAIVVASVIGLNQSALAQDYIYATGNPTFGVNIPIENGYINVANGNVHLEIPIATHTQRGNLQLNERLVYDSRIWMIGHYSNYYWWPNNVPSSMAGWRFVNGLEIGSIGVTVLNSGTTNCAEGGYENDSQLAISYTDPNGTSHATSAILALVTQDCQDGGTQSQVYAGTALDASGYSVADDGTGNPLVRDNNGNEVYPNQIDRFGNYWTQDANGNLIDDLNRTPVITTTSGSQITYSVLGFGGGRVSYVMTTTPLTLNTHFNQSGVTEESSYTVTAIQSIQLPDGSSYSFTYDNGGYGEMTSMTLPSGGVVQFGYSNYVDSYQNTNRWLTSYSGGKGSFTFAPKVLSACSGSQLTGCQEQVTATSATLDDTVYTLTLNNGAWNTTTDRYQGPMSSNHKLISTATGYNFSTSCPTGFCVGADYVTKQSDVTTLSDAGYSAQTVYGFNNPSLGKVTSVKQWDYYAGTPPAAPTVDTELTYTGYDLTKVQVLDGASNQISLTSYNFNATASTSTAPASGHNAALGTAGPYLSSVVQWINTTGQNLTTTFTNDDAGSQLTSSDPTGQTSFAHDATGSYVTGVTPPTPSSGVSVSNSAVPDPSTGLPSTTTDPNQKTTTYVSYDWAGRPTQINYPDQGQMIAGYTATSAGSQNQMIAGSWTSSQTQFDGYGRLSRTALGNGQSTNPYYQTDYCYDANGRLQFKSYPYQGNGWGTAKVCSGAGDSYTYDALGRPLNITHSDGYTYAYSYTGRSVKTTDENGVQRILLNGAFGQTDWICEISSNSQMPSSGAPVNCGLDIPGTGFLTQYGYSLASHEMIVAQGNQTRVFQTDSLGRSILATEPERGNTTYSYSYSTQPGLGLTVIRSRGTANQANPANLTTTTTQYDSLGRVVSVVYSDGTPTKTFTYDAPSSWTEASQQTNLKGRLSSHYRVTAAGGAGSIFGYDAMGRVSLQYSCLPSGCGNSAYDRKIAYAYNLAGMLTSEGDGAGNTYTYTRSLAGEIWGLTDSYSDATDPANIILPGSVASGPFGPTSYILGNGLTAVNSYDARGRLTGGWVCAGSSQPGCTGGTQQYGYSAQRLGTHVTQTCDTAMNLCNSFGYDEFNRLTARTVTQGTVQNYTYTYDRYGNRWAQNAPQGGFTESISFNTYNNIITTSGFANDVPGNIADDGYYGYSYDADGNLISVGNPAIATYYYDSLNQRVREAPTRGTYEFVWDTLGRRVSNWYAPNHSFVESNAYTDSGPIAFRLGGQRQFEHQNWLGTERVRTTYNGAIALSIDSLPWADGHTPTGDNGDQHDFELMDRDLEDNTEHAQFRQYSTNLARWMSPDSYNGSYDFTNPQSFNRYSYASNDPANFIDPSGQDFGGSGIVCVSAVAQGGANVGSDAACAVTAVIDWLFFDSLFGGGPSFHGSLQPRPSSTAGWDGNFGESLGIPTTIPQGNLGIGIALSLPSQGCEFGACGEGAMNFGGGGDPSTQIQSLYENILEHLEKIAADPNNQAVPHWKGEIENWTKQILNKAGRRPGSLDRYLQRIIGISASELQNLLPSPIFIVNPCATGLPGPYCNGGPYHGPA